MAQPISSSAHLIPSTLHLPHESLEKNNEIAAQLFGKNVKTENPIKTLKRIYERVSQLEPSTAEDMGPILQVSKKLFGKNGNNNPINAYCDVKRYLEHNVNIVNDLAATHQGASDQVIEKKLLRNPLLSPEGAEIQNIAETALAFLKIPSNIKSDGHCFSNVCKLYGIVWNTSSLDINPDIEIGRLVEGTKEGLEGLKARLSSKN